MYDIIIIGSGPAGLSAAVYAQREQFNAIVIEKQYMGTGQISKSERVDNYLGIYGESGYDLGEKFRTHAEELGTKFITAEVIEVIPYNSIYKLRLSDGTLLETKNIIYAAGAEHRKLGIKGESEFSGKGVSYCALCDGAFFRGKTVSVIGGGDTALGDALLLSKISEKVYLIHRRDEFRANKTLQLKVRNTANIEPIMNAVPVEIFGDKRVSEIKIQVGDRTENLSVDGVFVAIGNSPNSSLIKNIVELDKNGYVIASEGGRTSAKGIFVAGDVRTKHLRQVATAVSDGANCIESIIEDFS